MSLLAGCIDETPPPERFQGYAEGEFAMMAAPAAGTLAKLNVKRGDLVKTGTTLFSLEQSNEEAARREAVQRLRAAEEKLANLRSGRRLAEVEVTVAQAAQAAAARKLSAEQLRQQEKLHADGFISRAALDQAHANHERDIARLNESEAQGKLARQPLGRDAEIRAAAAEVEMARAVLAQGDWRLARRSVVAAGPALVQDTYFVEGEWVPAGRPVVSLLPTGNVKVRFFLPEQRLGGVQPGNPVSIACDGCGSPIAATVSYISKQAEYTPPVIYSKDSRAKLVFMLEARPSPQDAARLRPGQPVDVTLSAHSGQSGQSDQDKAAGAK
jgi:HlyD family secretion protein